MSKRKLDMSYAAHKVQLAAHAYAREAATRPTATPALLEHLGLFELVGETAKDRRKALLEYFEELGRQIRRQSFVDLVSSFESDLFRLLGMASSKARYVLKNNYPDNFPFARNQDDLIRTIADFSNLGGYKRLLSTHSSSQKDPRRDLWDVISHRDYLAHGERWAYPANPPSIDFAYNTLSNEINRVETSQ